MPTHRKHPLIHALPDDDPLTASPQPRIPRRVIAWAILAPALVVAIGLFAAHWWSTQIWTFERLAESHREPCEPSDWILWAPRRGTQASRTPGGEPLPGEWKASGGPGVTLRGPTPPPRPDGSQPWRWYGYGPVDSTTADGKRWYAFVRSGTTDDFAALGNHESLVGRWRANYPQTLPEMEFAPDGRILSPKGAQGGRWAGDGHVLVVHFTGMDQRSCTTLVRLEDDEGGPDGYADGSDYPLVLRR